jgi:hypothetical protein
LPQGNGELPHGNQVECFTRQPSNSVPPQPDSSPYRNPTIGSFSTAKLVPFFAATDRWVETRLAEVVTLDCLGAELKDETEVYWAHLPARQKIPFEHIFRPAAKEPKQMLDW